MLIIRTLPYSGLSKGSDMMNVYVRVGPASTSLSLPWSFERRHRSEYANMPVPIRGSQRDRADPFYSRYHRGSDPVGRRAQ